MAVLKIKNYIIDTPIYDILLILRNKLLNGKLHDIKYKTDELVVTCPNDEHDGGHEQTPDCHINLSQKGKLPYGWFHCFACNAAGPFVKFVALCFSSTLEYAEKWLITNFGKESGNELELLDINFDNVGIKSNINIIDKAELANYQSWTPYLQKRGLSRSLCESFNVKYDSINRQVIFPCYDIKGNLIMLPKRNIDNKIFFLDDNVEKPLYCIDYIAKHKIKYFCLVEGPIDCLTCYANNIPAVATLGSPSIEQINILNKKLEISTIYLMFDNDEAGRRFTNFVKSKLDPTINVIVVTLPKHRKDVNDLTKDEIEILKYNYNLPKIV